MFVRDDRHGLRGVRELAIQTRHDGISKTVVLERPGKLSRLKGSPKMPVLALPDGAGRLRELGRFFFLYTIQ